MREMLTYLFWPNPGPVPYDNLKVLALVGLSLAFIVAAALLRWWRKRVKNPVTKRLSRSWATASGWFGGVGLFLVICRTEGISYLSMRLWWGVWIAALLLYLLFQIKVFSARHYQVLPRESVLDPRDPYLPKKKR